MSYTRIIPNAELIAEFAKFLKEGHTVKFRVRGFSMRPFLEDCRDLVLLESPRRPLKVRDVVLAEISPGVYVLHRLIKIEGEELTLRGDGNVFGTENCKENDVVGIATGFYRKGRTALDSVEGRKWKIYSSVWLALSPIRRYLLAIYRRLPFLR